MAARRRDLTTLRRFLPLLVALLGAIAACIGASMNSLPLPLDVIGVFLALGLAVSALGRAAPARGALFLLALCAIVVGIVYGG